MSKSTQIPVTDIILNEDNPRQMSEDKFPRLIESLLVFPKMLKTRPMVLDENGVVLGGNMRTRALLWIKDATLQQLKERLEAQSKYKNMTEYEQKQLIEFWQSWQARPKVYVTYAEGYTEEEKREFVIKDNTSFGEWDWNELANKWEPMQLDEWGLDCWQPDKAVEEGGNGSDGSSSEAGKHGSLSDKFIAPPFTILDTRQGYWRQRKAMWRERIADFGESREGTLADGETNCMATINNGVSLLDPVMAEIVCRWFGIEGGTAFDCFAGDTVFGYVAATLGMSFTGIELREEQATLNNERVEGMCARYICDDGQNVGKHIAAGSQDLLFSCPPYYDLEVYSDKPNDASNQPTYEAFLGILENAFASAIDCLKQNRFAVIVVGDIRDNEGYYYDFVGDIKRMFKAHGMPLYNECIIVEPIGTLPQRVQRYMRNRKVGKCHQNVLVFYKGDIKAIPTTYNEITYASEDLAAFGMDNNDTAE
ncbi:site-specific DNA-methyltransferase [Muribaculum intestinale]|uniref:site-specific DNA-methyltransferase n=1 Tax=Muribaculum intestinale TaxID=1796646 RepID=UPI00272A41BF|nr:site-specific DNA-methyltransferase [Muribaculum intestinale]